jgi:pimeloyl-ACP methyl ester carboxylesterase
VGGTNGQLTTEDGRTLAYRRVGSGPTLVCHPGGPGFSSLYLSNLGGLDAELELVLFDPRGTGGSSRPSDARAFQTDDYVADLELLRSHLELERMLLFGHSHGGIVAACYAARHPERVEQLILASSLARFFDEQRAAMKEWMDSRAGEPWYEDAKAALAAEEAGEFDGDEELAELALREFPFYFAEFGERERAYLESLRGDTPNGDPLKLFNAEIAGTFDLRPELVHISAPTLVVTGELDFITGPISAADFSNGIVGARTTVIPGAGHFVFVEAPDAFRAAVLSFLGVGARA